MKTRIGFVSNSSSSSYVLIIPEEAHKEVYEALSSYHQAVVDALEPSPRIILGQECVVIQWCEGNNDSFEYLDIKKPIPQGLQDEADNKDEWVPYLAFQDYQKAVTKYEGTCLLSNDF